MKMKGIADLLQQFAPKVSERDDKSSKAFSRNLQHTEVFDFLSLVKEWPQIVGEKLAKHTVPVKNSRTVLTILTDHPAYGQELSFLQTALIKKIETAFPNLKGKITRLLFQNDPTFFKTKSAMLIKQSEAKSAPTKKENAPKYHQHSPEYKLALKEAKECFAHLTDDEAREALISLFIQAKLN